MASQWYASLSRDETISSHLPACSQHWGEVSKRDEAKTEAGAGPDVDQLFISNTLIPNTKIMSFYRTEPFLITTQYT